MRDNNTEGKKRKKVDGRKRTQMTAKRWKTLVQFVANGATRTEACKAAGVSYATYRAYVIADDKTKMVLQAADREWIRRDWPMDRIDQFLIQLAMGKTGKEASFTLDYMEGELEQLMHIIMTDTTVRALYDTARQLQAEAWADDIVQISDDGSNDTYQAVDKKGNTYTKIDHDVINRSKLRIDTRKWIMSRLHFERYGDRLQQNISGELNVNHSEILETARKRRERGEKNKLALVEPAVVSESTPTAVEG